MFKVGRNKYDEKYVKRNYITEYKIDDKNKKLFVYYIDGTCFVYPLSSKSLNNINSAMKIQYNEWQAILKQAYMFNLVKLLYINVRLKKQKYYLEHEYELKNCSIKNHSLDRFLSKGEIDLMKDLKKETNSYFNLSSVGKYKLSTMKRIVEEYEKKQR